ncbi:hypothetical protein SKP52_02775 [Sphingopyxis fribergensis]|uniref:Phage ABA sandwich domain-containing protein n=1 Tax=Sphingopyxis fribergensis TaxID=1515612 RepID=A0A0A7PBV6_9SPHN|nr:hypothetical protein [Sphingopyxis fribergensis]AJA07485.1 hypothetical protein SKP52_02775 [Sphingopyxis fribergensis]
MTPSDEMRGLIERIEAATGDDPELFWDVQRIVNPDPPTIWKNEQREVWTPEYAAYIACWHRFGDLIDAVAYTDAAITVIPDGWTLFHLGGPFNDSPCHATVGGGNPVGLCEGTAATPALALCAASLRAISTMKGKIDG